MSETGASIPPGWYPDPSGERQWRVWNGAAWSNITRAYGPPASDPVAPFGPAELDTLSALHRLNRFGLLAYYVGFALVVSVTTHWPGHARAMSLRVASPLLGVAIGLTLIGALAFAAVVRALRGRWSVEAVVPVLNSFVASSLISRRLGIANNTLRLGLDALVTLGYVTLSSTNAWFGVFFASVAAYQYVRSSLLVDVLAGARTSRPAVLD